MSYCIRDYDNITPGWFRSLFYNVQIMMWFKTNLKLLYKQ